MGRQHQPLPMPDVRSLQLAQNHLATGVWQPRHLDSLVEDARTRDVMLGLVECTQHLIAEQQPDRLLQDPQAEQRRQRKLQMRNLLCVCNAFCPEETRLWADCVRRASKALKETGACEDCAGHRHRLERCAERQTAILLQVAMTPPDRGPDLSL